MKTKLIFLSLVLVSLFALPGLAAPPASPSPALDRLAQVGRLWGTVRYLHPYLLDRDIDWDAALVAAMPRIEAAKSKEEYAAAVQGMLDALGDPATRVLPLAAVATPAQAPPQKTPPAVTRRLDGGTLVVDVAHAARTMGFRELMRAVYAASRDIGKERAVIVDLRGGQAEDGVGGELFAYALAQVGDALVSRPCRAPSQRFVQRSGFRPQEGSSSGGYYYGFVTPAADTFSPPPQAPAQTKRVVFLMDRKSGMPPLVLALQAVGDGRIVADGTLGGEDTAVSTRVVDLGEGLRAMVRMSEMLPLAGWPGIHADVEVAANSGASDASHDAALAAAVAELEKDGWGKPAAPTAAPLAASPILPDAVFRPDKGYPEMIVPDLVHRRLAVIQAWSVIHFFYPYLHLIGDWDAVLPEYLAKIEKAKTGRDYALTILEMMAHVTDGHTGVWGHPEIEKYFGEAWLPLAVRWIEGAAVVTAVGGDEVKAAGIAPGDAIVAVDGEPVAARIERLSRYVTASTQAALLGTICAAYLLRGPAGPAVLTVQSLDGPPREVRLTRDPKARFQPPAAGDVVRILPGNLGYVDLPRLGRPDVDAMFEKVKDTRGLILDMRGYPQGTAWSIAPRINTKRAEVGAQFRRRLLSGMSEEEGEAGYFFSQPLPPLPPGATLYTAPVVMLIDERAISQSEHSGLFYEAANGTTFIGSPSAGANGDVTFFTLPGGISVSFTGHDVRHADGRQLQRVGLKPDVEVAPTRAGIRAGKDEVLERAVKYLEEKLAHSAQKR